MAKPQGHGDHTWRRAFAPAGLGFHLPMERSNPDRLARSDAALPGRAPGGVPPTFPTPRRGGGRRSAAGTADARRSPRGRLGASRDTAVGERSAPRHHRPPPKPARGGPRWRPETTPAVRTACETRPTGRLPRARPPLRQTAAAPAAPRRWLEACPPFASARSTTRSAGAMFLAWFRRAPASAP